MNRDSPPTKRVYQEIGAQLREQIAQGQYQVGDKLPPERELAEQLGVSRAQLREALIMLELENLVEVRKGSGIYVIALPQSGTAFALATEDLDVGPFEWLQARQLLESNIAELAAGQATKTDIAKMRQALAIETQAIENDSVNYSGDEMFHMAIAESTQNSILTEMLLDIWQRRKHSPMWQQFHKHVPSQAYRKSWLDDHMRILKAMQLRDPKAAKTAMWEHLENVRQWLYSISDVDDPKFDGYLFNYQPTFSE